MIRRVAVTVIWLVHNQIQASTAYSKRQLPLFIFTGTVLMNLCLGSPCNLKVMLGAAAH